MPRLFHHNVARGSGNILSSLANGGIMKTLVFLLVLGLPISAAAYNFPSRGASDPQFKLLLNHDCSDGCFDVDYSWPGEGQETRECTVDVRVTFSKLGKHEDGGTEDFSMTRTIHNTGSGWALFDGKSAVDTSGLLRGEITSHSCK